MCTQKISEEEWSMSDYKRELSSLEETTNNLERNQQPRRGRDRHWYLREHQDMWRTGATTTHQGRERVRVKT